MTSKKPATDKRANLPRTSDYAKSFLKDWERLSHSGRYDMNKLTEVMMLLIKNIGALPPEWLDHELVGEWTGYRECHVGGDFLLIYKLVEQGKTSLVVFVRAGTHSDLFK
jgi:mRNA interferase YafQ